MSNRILIVEDDVSLRQLFSNVLSHQGFDVVQAATCNETRVYMEAHDFDILICDVELEDCNALPIIEDCVRGNFPVVVISANESYSAPCRDIGVNAFVTKPITVNDFISLIHQNTQQ
jgi:DNA-binding response OmpR family regulator